MIVRKEIDPDKQPLTAAQKKMLQALKDRPIAPDEDNPALTEEQLADFGRVGGGCVKITQGGVKKFHRGCEKITQGVCKNFTGGV